MTASYRPTKATDKNLEAMRHFAETCAKRTGTYLCSDLSITAVVIEGLARHKDEYGSPLWPASALTNKPKWRLPSGIARSAGAGALRSATACCS